MTYIYLDPPFKSDQNYNVLFQEQNGTHSAAQIQAFEARMNVLVNIGKMLGILPAPMVDTVASVMRGRAILDANKLGIFRLLEAGPKTAEQIAEKLEISTGGTRVLLDALVACDYLKRTRSGHSSNGRYVRKWILESGAGLTHYLRIQENVWERASTLGECVKLGHALQNPHDDLVAVRSEAATIYVRGMKTIAQLILPAFEKNIHISPEATSLLDLGGSHGDFSRALLNRYPKLSATVIDLAGPIAAAEELAAELEPNPCLKFQIRNLLSDELSGNWDVVIMNSVLHVFGIDEARGILAQIREVLSPSGSFWIMDHLLGVSRTRDRVVAMMGLNFLTLGGRGYHIRELDDLLKEAGFTSRKRIKLPVWVGATMVHAM